jgi:hypothetical protein
MRAVRPGRAGASHLEPKITATQPPPPPVEQRARLDCVFGAAASVLGDQAAPLRAPRMVL